MQADILIVGAGAAGLMAARELSHAGRHVVVLEARDRVGGRAYTFSDAGFSGPTEAGAEFIHGEASLTRALLQAVGGTYQATAGHTYELRQGRLQSSELFTEHMPQLLAQLHALPHDMPLADFLTQYFPAAHQQPLRELATQFAEGYDAADAHRASTFALRDEWSTGGAEDSPRPVGGYGPLLEALARQGQAAGVLLQLNTAVQALHWQPGRVEALCSEGRRYSARQALLTVPLGVWQTTPNEPGHMRLVPELPTHRAAVAALGFGSVIKILLEFDESFWEADTLRNPMPELEFLLSDAAVPTWWSQLPDQRPLLTGWLAGPAAHRLRSTPDDVVLAQALTSLSYLFGLPVATLQQRLRAHRVINWGADPLARGAYTYATVDDAAARRTLTTPVEDTLFFAGEGLYTGPAMGTVEAALASGQHQARQMLQV